MAKRFKMFLCYKARVGWGDRVKVVIKIAQSFQHFHFSLFLRFHRLRTSGRLIALRVMSLTICLIFAASFESMKPGPPYKRYSIYVLNNDIAL